MDSLKAYGFRIYSDVAGQAETGERLILAQRLEEPDKIHLLQGAVIA